MKGEAMRPIYLFDCDETLSISPAGGPITTPMIYEMWEDSKVILGICGNWSWACQGIPMWDEVFSIIGPMGTDKPTMLRQIKQYLPATDYVLVGNDHASEGANYSSPDDAAAAREAGWRFISETDFANGAR